MKGVRVDRRGKFVLTRGDLGRALGLPQSLRVVSVYVNPDPDHVHVVVEGKLPPIKAESGVEWGLKAYRGDQMAPAWWHPSRVARADWGRWRPGDKAESYRDVGPMAVPVEQRVEQGAVGEPSVLCGQCARLPFGEQCRGCEGVAAVGRPRVFADISGPTAPVDATYPDAGANPNEVGGTGSGRDPLDAVQEAVARAVAAGLDGAVIVSAARGFTDRAVALRRREELRARLGGTWDDFLDRIGEAIGPDAVEPARLSGLGPR